MLATEFILEKRDGKEHAPEALKAFIDGYVSGQVPDYQVAAWLMAVCLRGMSPAESWALTECMFRSGRQMTWAPRQGFLPADKHSTGGLGDKTSLIIAPLVASFDVPVPMMAGRGLSFTGGTLDKMESIPGLKTRLATEDWERQMNDLGVVIVGQTEDICPADRKMYALRDVTSTVESVPLICASILSKKIAEGAKSLVMDVKFGGGAFMPDLASARELARALIRIGRIGGLKVSALLTEMNQPLGRFMGHSLEVKECLEVMSGQGFLPTNFSRLERNETLPPKAKDYSETAFLSVELSAHMLLGAGGAKDLSHARKLCLENLQNGKALKKFEQLVVAQGGNLKHFETRTREQKEILSHAPGYMNFTTSKHLGLALTLLGGGRQKNTDTIDPQVGIEMLVRHGDPVAKGQCLFKLHLNSQDHLAEASNHILKSFRIDDHPPQHHNLIHEVLT